MRKKEREIPEGTGLPERKKGLARLVELLDRDGSKFFKAGVLAFVGMLPYMAALVAAVAGGMPVLLIACIPAGMLAAPQICGVADTVMRSLRDEVGWWWWTTYKKTWAANARSMMLPGGLFGLLIGLQVYALYVIASLQDPVRDFWMLAAASVVEVGVLSYFLPMLVCMELPFPALLRNCFVMFFSHPIKSVLSAVWQLGYYLIILVWFPLTGVIFVATSVWLPMLISCNILYPALDKHFGLTEAYEKIRQSHWGGEAVSTQSE